MHLHTLVAHQITVVPAGSTAGGVAIVSVVAIVSADVADFSGYGSSDT